MNRRIETARDPDLSRRFELESHSNRYLACSYRVRIGATEYRYAYTAHSGPVTGPLAPELCSQKSELARAAALIRSATNGCRDLAGAGLEVLGKSE